MILRSTVIGFINIAIDSCKDGKPTEESVKAVILSWTDNNLYNELLKLINDFKHEMSPKVFFTVDPIKNMINEEDMGKLSDLAEKIWVKRYKINKLVKTATLCLNEVKQDMDKIGDNTLQADLESLYEKCRKLADAISAFPKDVLV